MELKAGETWKVIHSRKGALTIAFTDVGDEWATGEIVTGRARFMSDTNRAAQQEDGLGTTGDTITVRKSFLTLLERVAA